MDICTSQQPQSPNVVTENEDSNQITNAGSPHLNSHHIDTESSDKKMITDINAQESYSQEGLQAIQSQSISNFSQVNMELCMEQHSSSSEADSTTFQSVVELIDHSRGIKERIFLSNQKLEFSISNTSKNLESQQQSLTNFNNTLQSSLNSMEQQIQNATLRMQKMRENYAERFEHLDNCFDSISQTLSSYQEANTVN